MTAPRFVARSGATLATALALFLLAGCGEDSPTRPDLAMDDSLEDGGPDGVPSFEPLVLERSGDAGIPAGNRTYEIVLENLTPATAAGASQPFSPPVIATHDRSVRMFRPRRRASEELELIAEDAVNGPMVSRLESSSHVADVVEGAGVVLPGGTAEYTIQASAGRSRLSMAFMLVNTNDAFSGLDALPLPRHGELTVEIWAWDAGTEKNTELAAHIPGPCCGSPGEGVDTDRRIRRHRGIRGTGDLDPATYGWEGPVARLTIRALAPEYEIVLENLSPDNGVDGNQVFSPPVLASHGRGARIFRVGRRATDALAALAEDGMTTPLVKLLSDSPAVDHVIEGTGPIPPGASATFAVAGGSHGRRLSLATMLVNTNDGFTGVDSIRLPDGGRVIYALGTWDAGSEANSELAADIPGPCCGSVGTGEDTHERIHPHVGILGVGDLDPAAYGWEDPVATLSITRVR